MKALSILISLILATNGALAAPGGTGTSSWVVALKPDKDPEAMLGERKQLEAFLKSQLGGDVKVIVPLSATVILEGLGNGSIDLAYLSGTDMAMARQRKTADLLLAARIDGKTSYESLWLVSKDSPLTSLGELKGQPVAFASRTSTSGYLVPVADMIRSKLLNPRDPPEMFFGKGNVFYGTGYVSAVERVLRGEARAAAVSDYVFLKDKHLTSEQKGRLRILKSQGPVPTHVLAVSRKVDPARRLALTEALLSLNAGPNRELRDRLFNSELVKVDPDAHLKVMDENFDLTGIRL